MTTLIEEKVDSIVKEVLILESIEEAFLGFIQYDETQESLGLQKHKGTTTDIMVDFWSKMSAENHDQAIALLVTHIHKQHSFKRAKHLTQCLEILVEKNLVAAKTVCEALVSSDKLNYRHSDNWCLTFQLIRRIVGGVDYKGCRDLLKNVLERCMTIPAAENTAALDQVSAVEQVIIYILDRNACLLPAYFALNEITKLCPDERPWPHWKVGELLSGFVQSFRATARIVSVPGRSSLLPIVGHSSGTVNLWKLNPTTLRFSLCGPLPYDKELMEAQTGLLRYVLEQPYSKDMICSMLSLNNQVKQRCSVLEEQLNNLVVLAMERSESEDDTAEEGTMGQLLWLHLSSQLIFFVLFQFASFPTMVMSLYDKLAGRNLRKGRDHLMWVLLQFISGSIQKNALQDFLPVIKLYDLLYPEKDCLPVPDINKPACTYAMAATCIWIHLNKKAQNEKSNKLQRPIPKALTGHIDFLEQCLSSKTLPMTDYRIALLCNAYSTNTERFALPMGNLVEAIYGNGNANATCMLPGGIPAAAPTQPLPMTLLDSLTVHAKMSLIHSIVTRVIRLAPSRSTNALAPALVETYSRLLVYMEIESLGIKGFISQLLPTVLKCHAWGILHTLLEMFCYRLRHIQPHYRVQLLSHLNSLASIPQTNQTQLHLCVESTALRLITSLGSAEVQPQLSRLFSEPKSLLLSGESEELNRVLVLTLARALHITGSETLVHGNMGNWCKDILSAVMQQTPHDWSSHAKSCFPTTISDFFMHNRIEREDKQVLRRNVEQEYRKWKSMANENDIIAHFSMQGSAPLFLCILWKNILEDNRISPIGYKVLDRLGPRALSSHLRTFSDYLVHEISTSVSGGGTQVAKCVEALNDMIWKHGVITIDRLVLCLSLRTVEGNEAQVCFLIVQLLLLKHCDFRNRVHEFVKENSPEHWLLSNWHEKHMAFHRKYPERFVHESAQDMTVPPTQQMLPVYFGNVCLRFLPVFDIAIHRYLEIPPVYKSLESLLEHFGGLYKFHDRPVTFLYNTLHYYEAKLRDRPPLKRRLVQYILGSLDDIRPPQWCLTADYHDYMQRTAPDDSVNWIPEQSYYTRIIGRVVDTIEGRVPASLSNIDWRFNEFPNPTAHILHATCIELMALPVSAQLVGNAIMDNVLASPMPIDREKVMPWMNAIGLVLMALPESYWLVISDKIQAVLQGAAFAGKGGAGVAAPSENTMFHVFDFNRCHTLYSEIRAGYMLALAHAVWQHGTIGQLNIVPALLRDKLKAIVRTEEQYLFVCHLVGPFLQRFHVERMRCLLDVAVELYEMLEIVDKASTHLHCMDVISDFLYHIKYMFTGDGVKSEVERIVVNLRPALQLRLRFISHHGKEEAPAPSTTPAPPPTPPIAASAL